MAEKSTERLDKSNPGCFSSTDKLAVHRMQQLEVGSYFKSEVSLAVV